MANHPNRPVGGRPKLSNPIAHIAYQARDLAGVETTGGGGREFVAVTPALRDSLSAQVFEAARIISAEAGHQPDLPGVLVIKLREDAIAKSHRPLDLIGEAGLPSAGHGELNEMLVAVNPASLQQLRSVLEHRDTKKLRANISAISAFEPWDAGRRLPTRYRNQPLSVSFAALKELDLRLLVRLFVHASAQTTRAVTERFEAILQQQQLTYVRVEQRVGPPIFAVAIDEALTEKRFLEIVRFQGVRTIRPEPRVHSTATNPTPAVAPAFTALPPRPDSPVVAVFDTGVAPTLRVMAPWVSSRDVYILPPETDYFHGTAVSSLIISGAGLNQNHPSFPQASCRIHDVCALESGPNGSYQTDLILRLREALAKQPQIKIWNLSLGGQDISDEEFSDFGRELDSLSDQYGVLFVVAAGNYLENPRRGWPVSGEHHYADRLSSPGDSVRSLTVGAVTHLDSATSLVRAAEPASYSRRGPGPVFTPKPDLVHVGGNTDAHFVCDDIGVSVLAPSGQMPRGCGTSYAAPLAASIAAHTWQALELPGRPYEVSVSPTMVKTLMIHSAQVNSPERDAAERRYFGAGMPSDPVSVLYDSDDSFTMLFELDIVDAMKWRKTHYPIPPSLLNNGKFRGEVIVTAGYASSLNSSAGAEYVRFNVDVGFGTFSANEKGGINFRSCVPAIGELGTNGYEDAQVEHGGKWSPVKTYRRRFPRGTAGQNWGLQATILRRAMEPPLVQPLRVVIAVTLRALDGTQTVYEEGRRLLAANNWIMQNLSQRVDIQVQA